MKKIILLFIFFLCAKSFAQTNGITYQALILNPTEGKVSTATNTNSPLVSKDICMLFKFVDEFSNVEYQEVIRTKTDPYGMVNLIIGTGTQTAGYSTSFNKISWDSLEKNLVVGISFSGDCSSFTEISNQPFSSVPFAYSSINAVNVTGVVALENGGTNATTVIGAKTNLGLENVDNTTDLNKPISTASKLALNLKEDTINKSTNVTTDGNSDIKYPTVKSVKNYVDSSVSFNLSGLTNEISRATTAENTITANLVLETERATLAEATLTTNLTAEVNRATTAERTKEDVANKSIDGSFTSNSDVKFPTEKATKTYVDASSSSNSLALTNEISRATTAENTIASNLITETERATLAETNNATAITSETNRATLAETTLSTNLTAEVNRATIAEATKEDAANKSTDGSFTSNSDVKFPTEKATKTYVDASASSNSLALNNEISRATLAENTIAANLVSETERATLSETNNATAITAETNRATLAENTIAANLVSETERATLAETNYATAITGETNRATLAEATLTTNLTAEVNRATIAEATKEDAANKSSDGSFTSNSDVKFPTEKATKTYVDASASSNSVALNNEISRATLAENTIATNLVSETERATLSETTLSTNLTAEVNRATTAEATKEDAANKSTDGSFASNSDVKFPTEKATKTYVDASASSNSLALTNEISRATLAETTNATAITTEVNRATVAEATKEDAVNKSTDGSFTSNSDVKFPTEKATKTYVDASASSNSLALSNEISRATTAENAIAANLVTETERATLAEATNATAITAETNRATLAETTNATSITAETNRATLAENTLSTNLITEVNRATAAEATKEDVANKSTDGSFTSNSDVKFPTEKATKTYVDASASSNSLALTNEVSRATLAENTIAANLVLETERATLAEASNATAITTETNRASLAEATLTANLTAEVNRATAAEAIKEDTINKSTDGNFASNSDVKFPTEKATKTYVDASASSNSLALINEISRATLAENTIAANLVSETERSTLAENTLTTNLAAEVNRAKTAEATKEDAANKSIDGSFASNSDVKFPTEKATKTYVDATASSSSLALTNEISRATLAENTIAANLVSETERATLAEATLSTNLNAETNRAILAENTLSTNLTAEVNRATTAEATKEDSVNKSTDGSFASNSDVKFPTEKATKTYVDASASSNSLALTNEISRATLAENTIAANLVLETERATLAEATNATAINAETNRATLAETNNATAITGETNRASLAEATLTTNLTAEVNRATTSEATKEDAANKSTDGSFTSNSDVKFPTEKATKTYVDSSASSNSLALTNEISRATTAENTIAANLVLETERATLAEATLTTNLIAEINRATIAETTKEDSVNKSTDGSFTSNSDVKFPTEKATKTYVDANASSNSLALTNEISRATLAENTIAANLVTETVRATLAEATLATNITAEVNRATTAEATKEDSINKSTDGSFTSNSDVKFPTEKATKTYVDASASSNSLALTNEISRATIAENTIAANLITETERATLAETNNATAITAETTRATLAEVSNATEITAETNRASLAEATLTTNLTTEVNRATAAEATKEDAANKSTDGSFASNSDVKFPTEKATKTYVDASVSSNSLALTNEISRATTAENTIAANLITETERATLAETNNATAITAETTRATLAETTLSTNLTAEVNRATAAEATKEDAANKSTDGSFTSNSDVKFPTEKATKTYVDASASSNSLALTNEVSRATSAENTIAANLVLETERATLAESTLTTNLNAETNRATLAETTLSTNLTAEVNRATAAEATKEDAANKSTDGSFTSNSDVKFPTEKATKTYVDASASSNSLALTNEISRATLAENTIAANLVTETERATLAENTLSTNLTAEVNRATTSEATKEDTANKSIDGSFTSNSDVKFPTEKATKTYVDASTSSNSLALNNEITRATLAENTISANLVSENERATLAEATNATAITAETNRATLAETTLTTNLNAEVNRATTAEATKEDAANKSTDGSFTSNSDVKFPTEKATKTYVDASASSNSLALNNEISRATLAENTIAANLVSENERATLAEATNATSLTAETNRATLAEATLTTNLTAEVNRATTAEATKEDAVNKSTDGSFVANSDVKFPTEKATKTYVDASASSNSLALTNEISRATTAENTIAANLVSENERATLAEATNATAITAETNRSTLAENTIAANLVSETERATLAEATLTTNLTAETNRAITAEKTKEDAVNKSIDGSFASNSDVKFPTEKATKTYVDASASSNSLALNNEISRATLAENTNATAITTEVNRATVAEATKEDAVNKSTDGSFISNSDVKFPTEKATKTYVDASSSSNSLALTNEISRATLAENTIASNLVIETERATLAENTLATNLDLKANLASPSFTGTPSLPTGTIAVTQSAENNSTAIATTAFVTAANATNANLTGDVTSIGNLTTIAANVITTTKIADSNITNAKLDKANIPLSGFGVAASAVALGNNKLTEVADPTNPQDAATKNYVDALTSIGVTGNGTTNYIPKFSSSSALENSLIFDSGTQIGIGTNAPTSLFQIGGNGSGDNPLKYDYDGGGNGALKFGFRQYEYRIKSNQNSGVLENLTFSYYNQSTGVDSDRFVIANDGIYIPGKLNVTGTVNGGAATLSSLNVNNSQLNVNSSTNTIGFFTDSPTSKFQIGGDGNFDNPLKYDYGYGSGEGALKFGFRQNEFRIKTNQNSGVLEKLTFSYYKNADGTDIESMHIDNNGVVSITKLAVTAGSPGNGKVLTSDAFGNASWVAPVVASSNEFVDLTTTQTIAGAKTFSSTVTGNSFVKSGGTSAQYLMADGTVSTGAAPVREVADETSAAASQNSFTLTQTPSINSKVKMYVNGIRISNAAYSVSGTTLTYFPANNGSYILSVNDRVQFDYFY